MCRILRAIDLDQFYWKNFRLRRHGVNFILKNGKNDAHGKSDRNDKPDNRADVVTNTERKRGIKSPPSKYRLRMFYKALPEESRQSNSK